MNPRLRLTTALACAIFAAVPASAELLIGLTTQNSLTRFESSSPGDSFTQAVSGLAPGDTLVGIDKRPTALVPSANGLLYGVATNGTTSRLYTIDPMTGVATLASTLSVNLSGAFFGVDFNPTVDRLRVTSNTGQNLRINVDTGGVTVDTPLAYQSGDPNFGDPAGVDSVAYANNDTNPMTGTTLRGTEINNDVLVVHTNPNGGTLMTAISLPLPADGFSGYDISGTSGLAFFSLTGMGALQSTLFTAGPSGFTSLGLIGGSPLIGLAARIVGDQDVSVPEPGALALLGFGLLGFAGMRRRR